MADAVVHHIVFGDNSLRRMLPRTRKSVCSRPGEINLPGALHVEEHFTASEPVRDMVIGMADDLTVPFALARQAFGRGHQHGRD